ncbi:hypothetical protein [Streptomyces bobili]|uniref:hypothetical protein n=2 Tax=Streptomyces bobili TaxID=67280 RepID=UPI0037BD4150
MGPREQEDWRRDAASVMALKAIDPRGWNSVDHAPEVADGCSGTGGPFMAWKPEHFNSSLHGIRSASATQLLIALKGEW